MSGSLPSRIEPWTWRRRIVPAVLLAALGAGCVLVLLPLAAPIIWAIVLSYVTWPLFRRVRPLFGRLHSIAAALMTLLVAGAVVLPVLLLLIALQSELTGAFRTVTQQWSHGATLPAAIGHLPWIGPQLQERLQAYVANPSAIGAELGGYLQRLGGLLIGLVGNVTRSIGKLLLSLLILFFLYRDGERIVGQTRAVMSRLSAVHLAPYLAAAGAMTRAVVYGFLVTAMAQGLVAGIGYRIAGLGAPVLLGALTALLSLLPLFGTALVWVPISAGLLASGRIWQGVFLLAWGVALVHPTDNLLHPLLISSSARAPFLLILLGVLGGLAAFGLVGIVIGPVLLGVAMVLWRRWAEARGPLLR